MATFKPSAPEHGTEAALAQRVVFAIIPGSPVVIEELVRPVLDRRSAEWRTDVGADLGRLAQAGQIDVAALADDPGFIDTVLRATTIAMTTSMLRKRAALRAAVLNTAIQGGPDRIQQQLFLAITDRFTETHLALLSLLHAPSKWRRDDGSHLSITGNAQARLVVEKAFPEAQREPALYDLLWLDLFSAGLVWTRDIDNGLEGHWHTIKRTTPLGERYLAFITSPI